MFRCAIFDLREQPPMLQSVSVMCLSVCVCVWLCRGVGIHTPISTYRIDIMLTSEDMVERLVQDRPFHYQRFKLSILCENGSKSKVLILKRRSHTLHTHAYRHSHPIRNVRNRGSECHEQL